MNNQSPRPTLSTVEAQITLEWFYNMAEYCCGNRSNFQATAWCLSLGVTPGGSGSYIDPEEEMTDGRMRSITRHRKIRSVLARCSKETQSIIRTYHEPNLNRYAGPIRNFFEDLTPIAIRNRGLDYIESIIPDIKNSSIGYELKSQARRQYNKALEEFANEWTLT